MVPNPLSVLCKELGTSEDDPKNLWILAQEIWKLRERADLQSKQYVSPQVR